MIYSTKFFNMIRQHEMSRVKGIFMINHYYAHRIFCGISQSVPYPKQFLDIGEIP